MSKRIYVGNLAYAVTKTELEEECQRFGKINDVHIPHDKGTGLGKGFGFVEFESADAADEAIAGLHEKEFHGRMLRVSQANPKENGHRRP